MFGLRKIAAYFQMCFSPKLECQNIPAVYGRGFSLSGVGWLSDNKNGTGLQIYFPLNRISPFPPCKPNRRMYLLWRQLKTRLKALSSKLWFPFNPSPLTFSHSLSPHFVRSVFTPLPYLYTSLSVRMNTLLEKMGWRQQQGIKIKFK